MPFQSQQPNITLFAASAKPSKMPSQDLIRATNNSFHSIHQRNTVTTSIFKKNILQQIVFNKCICQGKHMPGEAYPLCFVRWRGLVWAASCLWMSGHWSWQGNIGAYDGSGNNTQVVYMYIVQYLLNSTFHEKVRTRPDLYWVIIIIILNIKILDFGCLGIVC